MIVVCFLGKHGHRNPNTRPALTENCGLTLGLPRTGLILAGDSKKWTQGLKAGVQLMDTLEHSRFGSFPGMIPIIQAKTLEVFINLFSHPPYSICLENFVDSIFETDPKSNPISPPPLLTTVQAAICCLDHQIILLTGLSALYSCTQNVSKRKLPSLRYHTSHKTLQWLHISLRRQIHVLTTLYKALHHFAGLPAFLRFSPSLSMPATSASVMLLKQDSDSYASSFLCLESHSLDI